MWNLKIHETFTENNKVLLLVLLLLPEKLFFFNKFGKKIKLSH